MKRRELLSTQDHQNQDQAKGESEGELVSCFSTTGYKLYSMTDYLYDDLIHHRSCAHPPILPSPDPDPVNLSSIAALSVSTYPSHSHSEADQLGDDSVGHQQAELLCEQRSQQQEELEVQCGGLHRR